MLEPDYLLRRPSVVLACLGDLMVTIWRGPDTGNNDLREVNRVQLAHLRKLDRKIVSLTITEESINTKLDAEGRQLVEEASRSLSPYTKASALALLSRGFGASIIRSIVTALMLVRRREYPSRVHDDIDGAIAFVQPFVFSLDGRALTREEIQTAIAAMRRA